MEPTEISQKLQEMGIPAEKIEKLLQVGKSKSSETWDELMGNLNLLTQPEQIRTVDIILEQAGVQSASDPNESSMNVPAINYSTPAVVVPKETDLARRTQDTIKSLKTLVCLGQYDESQKITDEWDAHTGCEGQPVYVCHHCKSNVCSTHSYWIPDHEFPFLVRKPQGEEENKRKKMFIMIGILIIIFGVMFTGIGISVEFSGFIGFGVVVLLIGVLLIVYAFKMKEKKANIYPEFMKTVKTKWGNQVELEYQHLGFYTAVHCWQCLKTYHSEFIETGKSVFSKVYTKTAAWKKSLTTGTIPINEPERLKIANYAANLFLSDFKFALNCLYPTSGKYRELERPAEFLNRAEGKSIVFSVQKKRNIKETTVLRYYPPTPIWLLTPIEKKTVEYIELDKWIETYEQHIKGFFSLTS